MSFENLMYNIDVIRGILSEVVSEVDYEHSMKITETLELLEEIEDDLLEMLSNDT